MDCKKCSAKLVGRQVSYCSKRCSKLHLKSLYKKRNRDKISAYARTYRKLGKRPLTSSRRRGVIEELGLKCNRCLTLDEVDLHHVRPLRLGGTNHKNNLLLLCKDCHRLWHIMFNNNFWLFPSPNQERL